MHANFHRSANPKPFTEASIAARMHVAVLFSMAHGRQKNSCCSEIVSPHRTQHLWPRMFNFVCEVNANCWTNQSNSSSVNTPAAASFLRFQDNTRWLNADSTSNFCDTSSHLRNMMRKGQGFVELHEFMRDTTRLQNADCCICCIAVDTARRANRKLAWQTREIPVPWH